MSIFQKIASVFADKAIAPKLENAAIAFVDNTFVDKNLEEGIIADLLETYGNEPFYNDFDGYITRNNVINNLIKSVRGNSSLQPNFRTGFIRENEARFLSQYPKYKHRPVHHSQICCIFEKIFDAVSLRINTLNPHSDIGKLQNMMIHKRSRKRPGYFIMYVQFWRELRKSFRMMQKNGSNILS